MTTLEVRDLGVEVGGLPVLRGLTLTVAAGEKVGVVGRTGRARRACSRVLAGESPPLGGRSRARGALGYLRQDPRQHRADDDATGLAHILAARELQEMYGRLEKIGWSSRSGPDAQGGPVLAARGAIPGGGGNSAEAEASASRGLGLAEDRLSLPVGALSGGERRRVELGPHPVRRERTAAARRAHEPPRRRREGLADGVPRAPTAARCSW